MPPPFHPFEGIIAAISFAIRSTWSTTMRATPGQSIFGIGIDDIEVAINELSPHSTQSISRATMSPMINALTNATVASVIATIEEDTEVPVPRRTTRTQSVRLNLTATFNGFVPANNPDAWRDRDLE